MQDQVKQSPADIARKMFGESPYRPIRELQCDYEEGVLTVAGRVPSFYLKQVAQTIVCNLDGVSEVRDQIEVAG